MLGTEKLKWRTESLQHRRKTESKTWDVPLRSGARREQRGQEQWVRSCWERPDLLLTKNAGWGGRGGGSSGKVKKYQRRGREEKQKRKREQQREMDQEKKKEANIRFQWNISFASKCWKRRKASSFEPLSKTKFTQRQCLKAQSVIKM